MTTYTLLAKPFQAWIRQLLKQNLTSYHRRSLEKELERTDIYLYELTVTATIGTGLVQVVPVGGGLSYTVPLNALAELKPLTFTVTPHCPLPVPVGATVEILGVKMTIVSRRQCGNSWEYEAKPVNQYQAYWHMDLYPHSLIEYNEPA